MFKLSLCVVIKKFNTDSTWLSLVACKLSITPFFSFFKAGCDLH